MPRRYLALWFPFLATDRLRRTGAIPACGGRVEKPHVLVETQHGGLRLVDCDPCAVRLGLTRGLTLADARARIPDLVALEAQPRADLDFLEALAGFCDRFTPLVACDEPHGLILDITGCAHLFGGEAGMIDRVGHAMRTIGLTLKAAIAGTPDAARASSRFGGGGIVPPGREAEMLCPLPVAVLEVEPETVIALSRAGLKTLAHLAARPSATLSARFGEVLVRKLRRILGHEDRRITPLRPPPDCVVERHFAEPFADAASLEAVVARLVGEAARVLEARGEGGRVFEFAFFRSDGAVRRLAIETGRPSREGKALLRLYRERIATLADPLDPGFGFDAIRLAVPLCEPLAAPQHSLDGRAVEEEAVADLVDRLTARFGRDRVLRFAAQDTHHPVRAAKALPAAAPRPETPWPEPEPDEPPARPLQLFEPPQPVEAIAEVPDGPPIRFRWRRLVHDVARAEGPERIAPEWWRDGSDEPMRDYYRVEDAQGRRFWLYRTGFHDADGAPPRWFLHGLFA
ncbi:DNA polymerase Y family protein [Bosea sp. (in: a-proteobacteria)]|uniref:Y-family DNA polymerase n=1 Tax=Bosea sp. (in: a-proteobacteria) TaxID=1871050 RepID=UPI002615BC86|nr:DNA polymerase Y family protein [Bosea sp. (in: a-proteobacteria)]MCO5092945.1 DNA polymerase Y family protein [Bosea sp. (in: a-proteobacteria)]